MSFKVIQWATGPIGGIQLREIIENPELELAGLLVYDPAKVGKDAGELVGLPPTGILATDDKAAILRTKADFVLHAASKAYGFQANTDDIIALLESGKNVITTTSYAHLGIMGGDLKERITNACIKGKSRFLGAGEHPGFVFERMAVMLTGMSQRVDRITLRQYIDSTGVTEKRMLIDLMGMGKKPEEISDDSPAFRAVSTQAEQALAAGADVLGLKIDEIKHTIKTGVVDKDVETACAILPAGTVVGQILSWSAYHNGAPVLTCEEHWLCTKNIPGWDSVGNGQTVRVQIDGVPNMSLELVVDTNPVKELGGVLGGYVTVAISAIRAIPYMAKAPPGVVVPEIFGAYRFSPLK